MSRPCRTTAPTSVRAQIVDAGLEGAPDAVAVLEAEQEQTQTSPTVVGIGGRVGLLGRDGREGRGQDGAVLGVDESSSGRPTRPGSPAPRVRSSAAIAPVMELVVEDDDGVGWNGPATGNRPRGGAGGPP